MLINSLDCSTCLFSWYGLQIMVGMVTGDFSQTRVGLKIEIHKIHQNLRNPISLLIGPIVSETS